MELFDKLKKMRLMLIDDDEWIRNSLTLFFESEGCYLTAVDTAEEALSKLKKKFYDIIITDYKLPGINGLEFLKQIQSNTNIHKILITGYGSEKITSRALKLGVEGIILKPFTTESIEKVLADLISIDENRNKIN